MSSAEEPQPKGFSGFSVTNIEVGAQNFVPLPMEKYSSVNNTVANLRGWVDDAFTINSLLSNVWQKQ
ncbi:hypothetical protein H6G04_25880 [Calothrix membranacea FACHB-236]|nr:hypothetical protein [Calothrix membranacea FACHB-236]